MKKLLGFCFISFLAVFLVATPAAAVATLMINGNGGYDFPGGTVITAYDNDADGRVRFDITNVDDWDIYMSEGRTKPWTGDVAYPEMILHGWHRTNDNFYTGNDLDVWFTETDFVLTESTEFWWRFDGISQQGFDGFEYFVDTGNTPFGTQILLGSTGYISDGPFDVISGYHEPIYIPGLVSLTVHATLSGPGTVTYNTRLGGNTGISVPEPATILLLGSGLIGLAGFGRKKFFKN